MKPQIIYILCIETAASELLPIQAFEMELAALDNRAYRLQSADIQEAMRLLNFKYSILPIPYISRLI